MRRKFLTGKPYAVLALSAMLLAGCGTANNTSGSNAEQSFAAEKTDAEGTTDLEENGSKADAETTEREAEESAKTENAAHKTLVVYYSASGNTERVAKAAAEAADADLFEIVPESPYTSDDLDWTDKNSRVSKEHDDEGLRDVPLVSTEVENWDSYDTVLLGYPIWWGIAAWPTDGFVKANDFTGKTVIPFCTTASSGIGESGELLEKLAGTGDWQEGMRFRSGASDEEAAAWVEELGLSTK